jgi:hypothetical protein
VRGQRHPPDTFYPQERPGTHCTGGWVGPRAGVWTGAENLAPTGIRSPDRPAHSQLLYQLSYLAHNYIPNRLLFFPDNVCLIEYLMISQRLVDCSKEKSQLANMKQTSSNYIYLDMSCYHKNCIPYKFHYLETCIPNFNVTL